MAFHRSLWYIRDMLETLQTVATLHTLLVPLGPRLSPELAQALADLKVDAATQDRLDYLADRNTAKELTPEEQAEYAAFVSAGAI